ncbi:MAG: sigma 54-interacting transcriptional regulator [Pseudomonadota bacterium]
MRQGNDVAESTVTRQPAHLEKKATATLVLCSSPGIHDSQCIHEITAEVVLGRTPGNGGLGLNDPALSREHARLNWHARHGLAQLEDLGSKNGTFVNGRRITRTFLEDGDVLRVGDCLLVFRLIGEEVSGGEPSIPTLVGRSEVIRGLKRRLASIAPGSLPVLLTGEPGTGKELAARALHDLSGRTGPFRALNCAAIPEGLFESVFFGHRKGAFTGAELDTFGVLREARGGTAFLDEVGEIPGTAQPKLLRFLQEGVVQPVGETREVLVDTRVVAATNADLASAEVDGRFRSDLLARLEGVPIHLPPLRERREDIPLLLRHFAGRAGFELSSVDPDAMEALMIAPWPRNVRGLATLVQRWTETEWRGGEAHLSLDLVPSNLCDAVRTREEAATAPSLSRQLRPSREELEDALRRHHGVIQDVADELGKDRKQIYRWMERYGITRETDSA